MKKLRTILTWALMIWGAVSLVGVLALAGLIGYQIANSEGVRVDKASTQDVKLVLNDCRIGEARAESVLHSYVSSAPWSFNDDHVDAYAIKVRDLSAANLTGWLRGDQVPTTIAEAVAMSCGFIEGEKLAWFPKESDLLSAKHYVWVSSVYSHGGEVISAELTFANPATGTIYYSSVKW